MEKFYPKSINTISLRREKILNAIEVTFAKYYKKYNENGKNPKEAKILAKSQVIYAFKELLFEESPDGFTRTNDARSFLITLSTSEIIEELCILANENLKDYNRRTGKQKNPTLSTFLDYHKNFYPDDKTLYDVIIQEATEQAYNIISKQNKKRKESCFKTANKPDVKIGDVASVPRKESKLYVVSDFHGHKECLEKCIEKINMGKRVVILGDAMDRGEDGIEILQEIIKLKKMGANIEYLPGNHDLFLVEALHPALRVYERTKDVKKFKETAIRISEIQKDLQKQNGVEKTYSDVIKIAKENPYKLYEIATFLETQPLLRIEENSKEKIALGHAAFDMEVYKRGYTLRDFMDNKDEDLKRKASVCLWYRESYDDLRNIVELPNPAQAKRVIVGHTPNARNVRIYGKNGTRDAICVDAGHHKKIENNEMIMGKYETGQEEVGYEKL